MAFHFPVMPRTHGVRREPLSDLRDHGETPVIPATPWGIFLRTTTN